MILTDGQIAAVASAAGFANTAGQYQGLGLTWAVAICLAESGGDTTDVGTNSDGSVDRGLWQINSVHIPPYDPVQLLVAGYNAAAAFAISGSGTSFTPWSTFSYDYRAYQFLARAAAAVGDGTGLPPVPAGGAADGSAASFNLLCNNERPYGPSEVPNAALTGQPSVDARFQPRTPAGSAVAS